MGKGPWGRGGVPQGAPRDKGASQVAKVKVYCPRWSVQSYHATQPPNNCGRASPTSFGSTDDFLMSREKTATVECSNLSIQ